MLNYEFPPLGGGASPVSYEIARGYVKLGHKVDVVTMHYRNLLYFEKKDGINIYRVKCLRSKKEICHPWEQLSYIVSAKIFLNKHLKNNNYDINHTHFLIPTGIISLWLKRKYGLDYIVTSHGSDVPGHNPDRFKLLHKFTRPILKKVCREAKKIISPSNFLANSIRKRIGKYEVEVIPNGVYPEQFKPKKKKGIILSTGRLLRGKGFQYLIKAVSGENFGYEVHIAGDGPMMSELKRLAKKSRTKIVLHGWLDNRSNNYKKLLETASIYILASEKENASVALLEAMSTGCAIITTNISGCSETVGNAGLTIEPRSEEQLKMKISFLIKNPGRIIKLGKKARQRLLEHYNWEKNIKKYVELLR